MQRKLPTSVAGMNLSKKIKKPLEKFFFILYNKYIKKQKTSKGEQLWHHLLWNLN